MIRGVSVSALIPAIGFLCLLGGAVALAVAARRAGRLPRRSCPRCRYDLVAAGPVPLVCPECGRVVDHESRLRRPRLAGPGRFVSLLMLLGAAGVGVVHLRELWLPWFRPTFRTLDEARNGPWSVQLLERTDALPAGPNRRVEVRFEGRPVHVFDGFHLRAGPRIATSEPAALAPDAESWRTRIPRIDPGAPDRLPPAGSPGLLGDADGDGTLDLVVEDPSGGSGAYVTGYVFALELGGGVRPTAILENAIFVDLGGDGRLDALAFDPTYAYRWTSGADRPDPRVILTAPDTRDGEWAILESWQFGPPPSPTAWRAMIEEIAAAHREAIETAEPGDRRFTHPWLTPLLRRTVSLAYAGHPGLARTFFDEAWPDGDTGSLDRATLAAELAAAMQESPFAAALELTRFGTTAAETASVEALPLSPRRSRESNSRRDSGNPDGESGDPE